MPEAVASTLLAQPDGWGDRRFPLVPPGRTEPDLLDRDLLMSLLVVGGVSVVRDSPVPPDGTSHGGLSAEVAGFAGPDGPCKRHRVILRPRAAAGGGNCGRASFQDVSRRPRNGATMSAFREAIARNAEKIGRKAIDMMRGRQIVQGDVIEEFWALKGVSFEVQAGRGRRHHRAQRSRQVHTAQDPFAHHRTDRRPGPDFADGSRACSRLERASTRS